MLKIYGSNGRAFRCKWMAEEAGIEYEVIDADFATGDTHTAEFLALNPNGKIPVLQDGELVLFESLAINLHLAQHYCPSLWPADTQQQSLLYQWTVWAMGELEGPHDAANIAGTKLDMKKLDRSLNAPRTQLSLTPYLLGEQFSVADLNVACLMLRPQIKPVIQQDPTLKDWFKHCLSRPALRSLTAK